MLYSDERLSVGKKMLLYRSKSGLEALRKAA